MEYFAGLDVSLEETALTFGIFEGTFDPVALALHLPQPQQGGFRWSGWWRPGRW